MFKIGDTVVVVKPEPEEDYSIGDTGTVVNVTNTSHLWADVRLDGYEYEMGFKYHTMYFKEIEKVQLIEKPNTFKVGDKVAPFKIGDKVKFKKSSLESGMIDASEEDVFIVQTISLQRAWLKVKNTFGYYSFDHLEHVKEETMNTNAEIKWEVGQEVWCLLRGKGVVECVGENDGTPYVVGVDFGYTFDNYTIDGKIMDDHKGRVLFFSEPKIEAERFPPKKPFVPKLKNGDVIFVKIKDELYGEGTVRTVHSEIDDRIYISENHHYFLKKDILSIRILSEEIIFN